MQPRQLTEEEVRDRFLDEIASHVAYWATLDGDRTAAERLAGLAHSILVTLDGCSSGCPAFVVAPAPHPDDRQHNIDEGENYYPEAPEVECDIAGGLHEQIHRYVERYRLA